MGDACKDALRVELHFVDLWLDSRIKLKFHGAAVTSDAGLVAYRELDEALGLTEMGIGHYGNSYCNKGQWP